MHFLRVVFHQLLSVAFHSFRADFYKIGLFWGLPSKQSPSTFAVRLGCSLGSESLSLFITPHGNQLGNRQQPAAAQQPTGLLRKARSGVKFAVTLGQVAQWLETLETQGFTLPLTS